MTSVAMDPGSRIGLGRPSVAQPGPASPLTRRGWVVAALIALALAVFVFKAGAATAGEVYVPTRPLVVTSGDTLWSIAEELSIPGRDVQDVVIELQRINGLTGSRIQAGDVLEVPRK